MAKIADDNLFVGLDIGTVSISALVGEVLPDGKINIIGVGTSPSRGMDKGGVNDLESVVKSVQRAVDQAELMAECKISRVFISISGKHIASRIEKGMGAISEQEVSQDDMDRVIHTAKSVKIGDEQRILHVIPQEFTIDYQEGIKNPLVLSVRSTLYHAKKCFHMLCFHSSLSWTPDDTFSIFVLSFLPQFILFFLASQCLEM